MPRQLSPATDATTPIPVIDRQPARFAIARVRMVADRGMISSRDVAELEARRLLYILGVSAATSWCAGWCSPIEPMTLGNTRENGVWSLAVPC
jgi:hypothetical protein